jgi:hypothetical protein
MPVPPPPLYVCVCVCTDRAHRRVQEGEGRRLVRLQAREGEERREVAEYWAGCVQALRCVYLCVCLALCVCVCLGSFMI